MQTFLALMTIFLVIHVATAADERLPTGALRRGTLANAKLIEDTKLGVAGAVGARGCATLGDVDIYVTSMPSGTPGSRRWNELWIVAGCHHRYPLKIEFSEDGLGAANWTIR